MCRCLGFCCFECCRAARLFGLASTDHRSCPFARCYQHLSRNAATSNEAKYAGNSSLSNARMHISLRRPIIHDGRQNRLMVDLGIHIRCSLRRADTECLQLTDRFPPGLFPPATPFATETTLRQPVCALGFSREPLICWIGLFCGNTATTVAWQAHLCGLPGRYCTRSR